jgi:hypothetical protein
MKTRDQLHAMLDDLPEDDLMMVSRLLEGLQITRATQPALALQARMAPAVPSPIRPVGTPLRAAKGNAPLANQYSDLMREEESPSDRNLLRKVMFTRVSDLMAWVNKGQEVGSKG